MKAQGQVRHRFHGQYSMVVGIAFDSTNDAELALTLLPGFALEETQKRSLYRLAYGSKNGDAHDARTEVDEVRDLLERFRVYPPGAHQGPIDGTPYSIDYGPVFHLDFGPAIDAREQAARQLTLPL